MRKLRKLDIEFLEEFGRDEEWYNKLQKKQKKHTLDILSEFSRFLKYVERKNGEFDTASAETAYDMLARVRKKATNYSGGQDDSNYIKWLNRLDSLLNSESKEFLELLDEQESDDGQTTNNRNLVEEVLIWFFAFVKYAMWATLIGIIVSVIVIVFMPKVILPIVDKCESEDNPLDCYYKVEIEKEELRRFTECQERCGRGIGNELCLEECEYTYKMGKWETSKIYETNSGVTFECPSGTKGYVYSNGQPYCE